jgi:hypothetical protein
LAAVSGRNSVLRECDARAAFEAPLVSFLLRLARFAVTEDLLQIDGLIRHVSRGLPLPLEAENVRLPRFTRCMRMEQAELSQKGKDPVVVCLSRTATFVFQCVSGKAKFASKDADRFIKLAGAVHALYPDKPVKGFVVVGQKPDGGAAAKLLKLGHLVSALTNAPTAASA